MEIGKLVYVACIDRHNNRWIDIAIFLGYRKGSIVNLWSVLDGDSYTMSNEVVFDNEEQAQKCLDE